jgi:acetyltransferase-like isoleucine patch superfamily enzyme
MIGSVIKALLSRVKKIYELRKYNPYTIAEYLRKQGMQVGDNCMIVPTYFSTEPYLIKIGNHVGVAQGVTFITHDGGPWIFRHEVPDLQVFGPIVIEDNCIIGQDSILFPNIRIGKNSIVGANSVVISDVPPDTIVMGVPARPFGSVSKYKEKCIERWNAQRPSDYVIEQGETWWNTKHFNKNREKLKHHLKELFKKELELG